jgi:hypothetical protein
MVQNLQYGPKSHIGDEILGNCKNISPNNPKSKYWATPILSYWGSFIGGLVEMLLTNLEIGARTLEI